MLPAPQIQENHFIVLKTLSVSSQSLKTFSLSKSPVYRSWREMSTWSPLEANRSCLQGLKTSQDLTVWAEQSTLWHAFYFPLSVYYFRPCAFCSMCFYSRVMAYKTALIPDTASAGSSHHAAERWIRNGFLVLQAWRSAAGSPPAHSGQAKGVRWKTDGTRNWGTGEVFHSDKALVAFYNSQTKTIKSLYC